MNTVKKHDAGLIVAGVLLVLCAFLLFFAPGVALVTLTAIAGAAFLVSGVFDIVAYVRFRAAMSLSGWAVAYAALDIVVGLMLDILRSLGAEVDLHQERDEAMLTNRIHDNVNFSDNMGATAEHRAVSEIIDRVNELDVDNGAEGGRL